MAIKKRGYSTLCYIFYLYDSEMYRLYRTKLYGPVMIKLNAENDVMIEIMGKFNIIL